MHFDLTQRFAAAPADVADAYTDPDLYAALVSMPKLGSPQVLDRSVADGHVRLRVRYRFVGQLSAAVRAVVDPTKLTWVEESDHDQTARSATFVLRPDHYADRLAGHGTYRFAPDGGGTVRSVAGELSVRAPLVASSVERAIISGLREHFDAEAPLVDRFVASR